MSTGKIAQEIKKVRIGEIHRVSLVNDIAEKILSYIVEQSLKPGDKLPSEKILSENLRVSKFPLREALSRLQALGIISVMHGKGAFVAEFNVKEILLKLSPILRNQSGLNVLHIVEARIALECPVAELAAMRRNEQIINELEVKLNEMERELNNRDAFINADIEFHEILASATENPIFEDLVAIFHNLMHIVQVSFPDDIKARSKSLEYHKEIFTAVRDRNPEQARTSMRKHLENIMEILSR